MASHGLAHLPRRLERLASGQVVARPDERIGRKDRFAQANLLIIEDGPLIARQADGRLEPLVGCRTAVNWNQNSLEHALLLSMAKSVFAGKGSHVLLRHSTSIRRRAP